jgi:hypothetical protein
MTRFDRVEPRLAELITELAAPSLPDYTDDVLARTAGLRQRPRWTLLERWLPMGVLAQRSAYIPRVPWRAIIVAALLMVVLAATSPGSGSQRRAAPPFGLAKNGLVMYDRRRRSPHWEPVDGSTPDDPVRRDQRLHGHLLARRDEARLPQSEPPSAPSGPELISIHVANADGSNPIDLTGPLDAPDQWDWSPAATSSP